jgi:hypothetical protein
VASLRHVNSLALAALVAGWVSARRDERGPLWTSRRRITLVLAVNGLLARSTSRRLIVR